MLIICILYEIIQLFYILDPPTECNAYFLTIPKIGLLPHLGTITVISHAFIIYTAHGHLHFYCTDCSALRKDSVFSPAVFSPGTLTPLSRAVDVRGFPETRWSPAGVCPASTVRHKSRTANVEIASNTTRRPCSRQHPLSMQRPAAAQAVMRILTQLLGFTLHSWGEVICGRSTQISRALYCYQVLSEECK